MRAAKHTIETMYQLISHYLMNAIVHSFVYYIARTNTLSMTIQGPGSAGMSVGLLNAGKLLVRR